MPDRLPVPIVRLTNGGVEPAREPEHESEGVLREVNAHLAFLARQDDVALDQLGRQDAVDTGANAVE